MFRDQSQLTHPAGNWFRGCFVLIALMVLGLATPKLAVADVVTDWNQITLNSIKTAATSPAATPRVLAIVQGAGRRYFQGIRRPIQLMRARSL